MVATLKMTKDDEEDDNLEAALDVVAKRIKKECSEIAYQRHTYSTKISKELSAEYSSDTLLQLLGKLSLDEDDTDVFTLLLHYGHSGMIKGSNVYM